MRLRRPHILLLAHAGEKGKMTPVTAA